MGDKDTSDVWLGAGDRSVKCGFCVRFATKKVCFGCVLRLHVAF